jgi:hypothetical protein
MKYHSPIRGKVFQHKIFREQVGGYRHLDRFSPQHNETLGTLHQESGELVAEDTLNLICLFDLDANTD